MWNVFVHSPVLCPSLNAGLNPNQCLKSCLGCGGYSVTVCWNSVGSTHYLGFPSGSAVENLPAMQETWEIWVCFLGWEDPLEEEMTTHSSILAWRIPWIEEPGGLQSMGLQRVGHDWAHSTSLPSWKLQSNGEELLIVTKFIIINQLDRIS